MKALQALQELSQHVGIPLRMQYYVSYIDEEEIAVITQAISQKAQRYQWNLLRLLALKIITQCDISALLGQHTKFKKESTNIKAALLTAGKDISHLRCALQEADRLIVKACALRTAQGNGSVTSVIQNPLPTTRVELKDQQTEVGHIRFALQGAQRLIVKVCTLGITQQRDSTPSVSHDTQSISWSESQDRQYVTVRQAYLAHNEALTKWDAYVNDCKAQFLQMASACGAARLTAWKSVYPRFHETVFDYRPEACEIRLSEENVFRFLQAEENPCAVYQDLTAKLMKKPAIEAMSEKMQAAKVFLSHKAQAILDNASQLRRSIVEETRYLIEQRVQVKLAHAQRLDNLSIALNHLTQLLQSYCTSGEQPCATPLLSRWLVEAKTLQVAFEKSPPTFTTAILEQKLLTWGAYRKEFAQSITTGWGTFFFAARRARHQREQQLNIRLQSALANLVTPLCGLSDHSRLISPEKIKRQCDAVSQLDKKQAEVIKERDNLQKIKSTFS